MNDIMKRRLYIISALFLFTLTVFSQIESKVQIDKIDWFGDNPKIVSIEINKNEEFTEKFGDFRFVGMTENGLIAYIFSPLTVVACEWEEHFYIYDLINNKLVWEKFACSVDWKSVENKTVKECAMKLNEYKFKSIDIPKINSIRTEISENDSLISIYFIDNESKKLLTTVKKEQANSKIYEAIGYFNSPFDKDLFILIFPSSDDIEDVFVYGLKN